MRHVIVFLALAAGLLSGCSDTEAVPQPVGLGGTYDLALMGRYVFVTSSDRNELRVLDLEASPRDFVRAPNPLEPLAVPVLPRPSSLTRDVRYKDEGGQVNEDTAGPYVYARSFGSDEISVVAGDPAYFKELKRLEGLGFVTAFAARGPEGNRATSVLYYAVQNGPDATLYRVSLPGPDTLTQDTALTFEPLPAVTMQGETVTALLVLPPPPGQGALDPQPLVIATRSTTGAGGRTFRLEVNNPQATPVNYQFGVPVRLLATHPRAEVPEPEWVQCAFDPERKSGEAFLPPEPVPAGQNVFGVLEEGSCGGQPECSGVVAVDASTGARATDATGLPMLPIQTGGALPTGLTLAAGAEVRIDCRGDFNGVVKRPLVGIVPASNGEITLFDALNMRQFDLNHQVEAGYAFSLIDSAGRDKDFTVEELRTHLSAQVLYGVTRDNTYRLVFQGLLPGLVELPRTDRECAPGSGSTCFAVATSAVQNVDVGDVIVLQGAAGSCEAELVVSEKRESELVTQTPIPAQCSSTELPNFSVRAASAARPFVVSSDRAGFLGRVGEGIPLSVPGSYFFHPGPVLQPDPQELVLTLNLIARGLTRGDQYVLNTLSNYQPFVFGVDTATVTSGLAAYRLPGSVVYTQVGDAHYAYVAYPSADGILQVALEAIQDNAANSTGLVKFE
ncbi:MAG: hypothetical protein JXB05_36555 [Myxococcaceae bacterium]|nr:hypothetical protein [Myxococcaceae bacterium]